MEATHAPMAMSLAAIWSIVYGAAIRCPSGNTKASTVLVGLLLAPLPTIVPRGVSAKSREQRLGHAPLFPHMMRNCHHSRHSTNAFDVDSIKVGGASFSAIKMQDALLKA